MSHRGDYRPIYAVLQDSDEFKGLSKDGKLLWYGIKLGLGPAGIGILYDEQLAERAGLEQHEVEPARQELIRSGWLEVEGRVHWLKNGLRFEPAMSLRNENHRSSIERFLKGLPKLRIVNRMSAFYGLAIPFVSLETNGIANGIGMGSDNPSPYPLGITETETETEPLTETDPETESEPDARARMVASLGGSTADFDGYVPTDGQRARAVELRVDLTSALIKWRGNRKSAGMTPADLVGDFDEWLEREPAFANGHGASVAAHSPPPAASPPRFVPAPDPELSPEERQEIAARSRAVAAALKADATPEPRRQRPQLSREEQLAAIEARRVKT